MKKYIPLILIEGATVMAVELCGAKMLAPMYGGSLFVWAAILAVTLGALASGYYYGGLLSRRNEPNSKLFKVILYASIFILLMPLLSLYVIPLVAFMNFKLAVIVSSGFMIFAPIFFLGCTTPLLVRINTGEANDAGLVSGKIYAMSTVGGIISTLLCGFCLIPVFGLKLTLVCFAIILFVSALLILKIFKARSVGAFAIALIVNVARMVVNDETNVTYVDHGIMGDLMVKDENGIRKLLINKTVQTEMDLSTKHSVSDYVRTIDSIVATRNEKRKALVLGLGGGLLANLIQQKNFEVDAVEFDPRITEVAKNYFELDPSVNCFNADARTYLNSCDQKYELIIFDLFKAEEQPVHTITVESFRKASGLLNESGTILINWHGYLEGELGEGTQILLNTLHAADFETEIVAGSGLSDNRNLLIICKTENDIASDPNLIVNTDDQPVIELANAKANLRWRQNYLRYYQSGR
jgi:predicted membrane-bound spermidine synthase